ncbi:MAG: hypothetical protein A2Y63_03490 [Candidatus Riflebacteria bacterium RBG_13_59_9]|nr:MAG: hypothetical protein A2Y63_03490 [Candidatus Riflebacteria bacterium RBG_13_59_9]
MRLTPRVVAATAKTLVLLAMAGALGAGLGACGPSRGASPASNLPRKIHVMSSDGWIYDVMGENAELFEKETGI